MSNNSIEINDKSKDRKKLCYVIYYFFFRNYTQEINYINISHFVEKSYKGTYLYISQIILHSNFHYMSNIVQKLQKERSVIVSIAERKKMCTFISSILHITQCKCLQENPFPRNPLAYVITII